MKSPTRPKTKPVAELKLKFKVKPKVKPKAKASAAKLKERVQLQGPRGGARRLISLYAHK